MKFHRITKPLTALALCALLATAYNLYVAPGAATATDFAGLSPSAGGEKEETAAAQDDAVKAAATEADTADAQEGEATAADTTKETPEQETAADTGADDVMPPMAIANSAPVPTDTKPSPNESRIAPTMKQLRTVNMNEVGTSDAVVLQGDGGEVTNAVEYVEPAGETHPVLNLTPDKSVIVRLDRPAASVIVGNEAHVSVLIDTPTALVVVPRMPGASYFTVMDAERRTVMKRHVVVGPAGQYVRVRRSCATATGNCEHTSTFYCPDGMCHPISTMQEPAGPVSQTSATIAAPAGMGGANSYYDSEQGENTALPAIPGLPYIPIPVPMPGYNGGGENESSE